MALKQRVYDILHVTSHEDRVAEAVDASIIALIVLNVAALVVESVESVRSHAGPWLRGFEAFSVLVFSVEYLLRVATVTCDPRYSRPVAGRLRFAATPMALIDLLAVLPFYLPFLGVDLRFVRVVRVFRVFRLARLGHYSVVLRSFAAVLYAKKEELLMSLLLVLMVLIASSTLMYFVEHDAQPETFASIPDAMWWGVCTLTTVGYGDVYPKTGLGRFLGACIAVMGIAVFALPAGVLGAAFVEEVQKRKRLRRCPHCQKDLPEEM
jgi:voltage-gated potassium channel